jgi:hypothetical protein
MRRRAGQGDRCRPVCEVTVGAFCGTDQREGGLVPAVTGGVCVHTASHMKETLSMGMRDLRLIGNDGSGAAKVSADALPPVCAVVGVRKVALGELVSASVCVCRRVSWLSR